jgi:GntR family transcriptional regulator/MocR family aminotransferase
MRLRYAQRRLALLDGLRRRLPVATVHDDPAGLFEALHLPAGVDEPALLAAAARRGVGLEGLSWHRSAAEGPSGLLAGYANLPEAAIAQAVRLLAEAVEEVGR